jgi:hypothetical protein
MKFVLDSPHASECVEPPLALAMLHNKALAEALKNLKTKLPGFKYSIFDYYHELLDRIKNPSKYGRFSLSSPQFSLNYNFHSSLL